jgi:hypothetical protein
MQVEIKFDNFLHIHIESQEPRGTWTVGPGNQAATDRWEQPHTLTALSLGDLEAPGICVLFTILMRLTRYALSADLDRLKPLELRLQNHICCQFESQVT